MYIELIWHIWNIKAIGNKYFWWKVKIFTLLKVLKLFKQNLNMYSLTCWNYNIKQKRIDSNQTDFVFDGIIYNKWHIDIFWLIF